MNKYLATIEDAHRHFVAELRRPCLVLVDVSYLDPEGNSLAKKLELFLGDIAEVAPSAGVENQGRACCPRRRSVDHLVTLQAH